MTLQVIGAGVGRTGTYSLKLAINQLGLGPCHHMEEVLHNQSVQVPLWSSAVRGAPSWDEIFKGYVSAVDWPTSAFFRELTAAYPSAKFVLTVRNPDSWVESFMETIYKVMAGLDQMPQPRQAWGEMAVGVITKSGFPVGLDRSQIMAAFVAHNEAVRATIPAHRLLTYQVKDGWEPLCTFLGVPVPAGPFPRTNDRGEFWERVAGRK